jgi:hypothetical protein
MELLLQRVEEATALKLRPLVINVLKKVEEEGAVIFLG